MKKSKDLFFFVMSVVLLGIVMKGFGPSFYFRKPISESGIDENTLPVYLLLHGIVLTLWIILFVVQSGCIQIKKISWHKRLGWFTTFIAFLVIPTGILAMQGFAPRLLALGVPAPVLREGLARFFWLDVFSLLVFPTLVIWALLKRKKPDFHKRFLLFSSICLLIPAIARLTAQIAQTESFGGINWPMTWMLMLALMLSVIIYDFLKLKKVHRATLMGFTLISISIVLAVLIAGTETGKDLSAWQFMHLLQGN